MTYLHTYGHNHLLDALPIDKHQCLFSDLELVPMPMGEVLHGSGSDLCYVIEELWTPFLNYSNVR